MAPIPSANPEVIGRYAEEIQAVRQEIGLDWYFSGAGVLRNVAMSLVEIGEYDAAIQLMKGAPGSPDLAVVMLASGLHALRQDHAAHAEAMLEQVEAKLPDWQAGQPKTSYAEVYSGLGALNFCLKKENTAAAWWKKTSEELEDPGLEGIVLDYRIPYAHACWEAGQYDMALDVLLDGEADFEAELKADYFVRIVGELLRMGRYADVKRVVNYFVEDGETWCVLEPAIRQALANDDLKNADFLVGLAWENPVEAQELMVAYLIDHATEEEAVARILEAQKAADSEDERATWLYWLAKITGEKATAEIEAEYQLMMDANRAEAAYDYLSEANAHLAAACASVGKLEEAWNCVTALDALDNQVEAAVRLADAVAEAEGMAAALPHFEEALVLAASEDDPDNQLMLRTRVIADMGARGLRDAAATLFADLRKQGAAQLENEFVLEAVVHSQLHAGDLDGALDTLLSVPADVENGALYETVAVATCTENGLDAALGIIQRMPMMVERMLAAGNCLQAAADVENFHWGWAPKERMDD